MIQAAPIDFDNRRQPAPLRETEFLKQRNASPVALNYYRQKVRVAELFRSFHRMLQQHAANALAVMREIDIKAHFACCSYRKPPLPVG